MELNWRTLDMFFMLKMQRTSRNRHIMKMDVNTCGWKWYKYQLVKLLSMCFSRMNISNYHFKYFLLKKSNLLDCFKGLEKTYVKIAIRDDIWVTDMLVGGEFMRKDFQENLWKIAIIQELKFTYNLSKIWFKSVEKVNRLDWESASHICSN
jgi:hypothetical protein